MLFSRCSCLHTVSYYFLALIFTIVRFIILFDHDLEWWWDPPIIHHVYRWPRFGCRRPRGSSSCEEIVAGHGCCTNRTAQALSLPFTHYHQLQAASWCGSLQPRGEYSCNHLIVSKIIQCLTAPVCPLVYKYNSWNWTSY